MTTTAKQALDELNLNFHYEVPFFVASLASPKISDKGMNTIRRALLVVDAVESGDLVALKPSVAETVDNAADAAYAQGKRHGWNDCLEHLKKIGDGDV